VTESSDALARLHDDKHTAHDELARERWESHDERHANEQKALDVALDADRSRLTDHRVAHEAAHTSHEKLHEAFSEAHKQQHSSESEAVKAAVTAMDRRLDEMNKFREQLRDQAADFARKDALDTLDAQATRQYEELRALIQTEREERRANEGVKRGMSQTTTIIVAAIGVAATLLSIVVILANFASTPIVVP